MPSAFRFSYLKSVCDSCHKRVLGLRYIKTGGLNDDGLIALNKHCVGSVAGDLLTVLSNDLVKTNVVCSFVLAHSLDILHRLSILKIEGDVDVCVLARYVEYTNCLVAYKLALYVITHIAVGYHPNIFSVHNYTFLSLTATRGFLYDKYTI